MFRKNTNKKVNELANILDWNWNKSALYDNEDITDIVGYVYAITKGDCKEKLFIAIATVETFLGISADDIIKNIVNFSKDFQVFVGTDYSTDDFKELYLQAWLAEYYKGEREYYNILKEKAEERAKRMNWKGRTKKE